MGLDRCRNRNGMWELVHREEYEYGNEEGNGMWEGIMGMECGNEEGRIWDVKN